MMKFWQSCRENRIMDISFSCNFCSNGIYLVYPNERSCMNDYDDSKVG